MDLQFVTLDVFTSKRLQGNPLAVVTVPATLKDQLTQATKQKIAQEFNLSETVFLHEVAESDQGQQKQRDIDIFTVESELPYAGHPTIGSAVLVKYSLHPHVDTLVTKAGPIGIVPAEPGNAIRARIPHNVRLHAKTLVDVLGSDDATGYPGLSPEPRIREAELKAPVLSVVRGMTFVLVRLPSLEMLARVSAAHRIDFADLPRPLLDEGWQDSFVSRYYYVDLGDEEEEGGEKKKKKSIRARMVELGFEDPATGSAATALGAYLTLFEERKGRMFKVTQGVEMGRTSNISVETTTKDPGDGSVALEELWLGGTAVVVMKGTLTVDI